MKYKYFAKFTKTLITIFLKKLKLVLKQSLIIITLRSEYSKARLIANVDDTWHLGKFALVYQLGC